MEDRQYIRNSTAEFLIFTGQNKDESIEVMVYEENIWMTQDLIIAVGFRTNSDRAIQFRKWAGRILRIIQ